MASLQQIPVEPLRQRRAYYKAGGVFQTLTACTTTTVFGFASATFWTSSSCRPGSARVVRSYPSDSHSRVRPTTTTTTSDSLASNTASWIACSGSMTSHPPNLYMMDPYKASFPRKYVNTNHRAHTRQPLAAVIRFRGKRVGIFDQNLHRLPCCNRNNNLFLWARLPGEDVVRGSSTPLRYPLTGTTPHSPTA